MNELFQITETPLSALQSARNRFGLARAAYDEAYILEGEEGAIAKEVQQEFKDALACLRSAEAAELRRLRE